MIKVSRNYALGEKITLEQMKDHKMLACKMKFGYMFKPSSFFINWSVWQCMRFEFYSVVKINKEDTK